MVIPLFIRIFANESKIKIMFGTKRIKELERKVAFLEAQLNKVSEVLTLQRDGLAVCRKGIHNNSAAISNQGETLLSTMKVVNEILDRKPGRAQKDNKKPFI